MCLTVGDVHETFSLSFSPTQWGADPAWATRWCRTSLTRWWLRCFSTSPSTALTTATTTFPWACLLSPRSLSTWSWNEENFRSPKNQNRSSFKKIVSFHVFLLRKHRPPFFKVLNSHYLNSSYQWEKRPSQTIVFLHLPTNPSKRHFRFLRAPAPLLKNLSREISLLVSYFLMKESNLVGAGTSRVSMDQKRYSKVSCYFRFLAS